MAAFILTGLRRIAHGGSLAGGNPQAIFHFSTNDTIGDIEGAAYFADAYPYLSKGDVLLVSADLDGAPVHQTYIVVASSQAGVTIAREAQANDIAGVGAGYKIARGVAAVTGTLEVTSGLATVVAAVVTLAADPVVGEAMWTSVVIPTQAGGDAGKFTIKTWKPTANDNATPAAGSAEVAVAWIAIGT